MKRATAGSLALLALTGCGAHAPLKCADYKDLGAVKRICRGAPAMVDAACPPGPVEDNGLSTRFRERMVKNPNGVPGYHTEYADTVARWCPALGTVFLAHGSTLETLLHELCHAAMGLSRAECDARFP